MELSHSDMNERQRSYREIYRERIATWYNGWVHVAIIYAIGIAAMYVYISNISNVRWWEWLVVPVAFIGGNIFEWWIHRYVMHRPQKWAGAKAIYTRHTLMHHQFFTEKEMRFASQHDWRVTFFPPYALIVFILVSVPPSFLLGWLVSSNVGWLLMCTTTATYMIYEFMHFCCHIEESWFVRHCPFVNTIRRHHAAHHDQSIMMERNMNLTFPIADWLFGTSDLDRGLLGHLFNGYSQRHLRKDLRRSSRTPKVRTKPAGAKPDSACGQQAI